MSDGAREWVWRYSPFRGATFIVHYAVADVVNDMNGNEFWASITSLAGKARVNRKTASQAVAELVVTGWLDVLDDHRHDRAGVPTRYRFVCVEGLPVVFDTRPRGGVSHPTPSDGGRGVRPQGVRRQTPGGEASDRAKPKEQKEQKTSLSRDDPMRGFTEWWAVMPKRNGRKQYRLDAEERWKRLPGGVELRRSVYRAAVHYAAACAAPDGPKAVDPLRFIGANRLWEDWLEAPDPTPPVRELRSYDRPADEGCERCDHGFVTITEGPDAGRLGPCPHCRGRKATG